MELSSFAGAKAPGAGQGCSLHPRGVGRVHERSSFLLSISNSHLVFEKKGQFDLIQPLHCICKGPIAFVMGHVGGVPLLQLGSHIRNEGPLSLYSTRFPKNLSFSIFFVPLLNLRA